MGCSRARNRGLSELTLHLTIYPGGRRRRRRAGIFTFRETGEARPFRRSDLKRQRSSSSLCALPPLRVMHITRVCFARFGRGNLLSFWRGELSLERFWGGLVGAMTGS